MNPPSSPSYLRSIQDYQLYSVADLLTTSEKPSTQPADDELLMSLLLLMEKLPQTCDVIGSVGCHPADPAWFGYRWKHALKMEQGVKGRHRQVS